MYPQRAKRILGMTYLQIGILAGLGTVLCAVIGCFGVILVLRSRSTLSPIPSPTNVPVVLDAISLMGKSVDEMRSRYTVTDSLYDLPLTEPDRDYANIDYGEDYTDGKYDFTFFYDKNFTVNQVDLTVPYYISPDQNYFEPNYNLSEWPAVMQMLNLNITYPPDETAPIAYVWRNYNGYRVRINTVINKDVIYYVKVARLK